MEELEININDCDIKQISSELNGSVSGEDNISYWEIDEKFLKVLSYSSNTEYFFKLNGINGVYSTYQIENLMYFREESIRENIYNGIFNFTIDGLNIELIDIMTERDLPDEFENIITIRNRENKINKLLK